MYLDIVVVIRGWYDWIVWGVWHVHLGLLAVTVGGLRALWRLRETGTLRTAAHQRRIRIQTVRHLVTDYIYKSLKYGLHTNTYIYQTVDTCNEKPIYSVSVTETARVHICVWFYKKINAEDVVRGCFYGQTCLSAKITQARWQQSLI